MRNIKADSNKEKILNCALELFYKKGYDAVGVQEIADAAGVTKPTLYYHFGSKYGLLDTLLKDKCTKLSETLMEAAELKGDFPLTLFRLASAYITAASKERSFYFWMISLFYSARDSEAYKAIKPYMKEQHGIMVNVFDNASDKLGNMSGRQEQFAIGFAGFINLYLLYYFEKGNNEEITADSIFSIVHQFMHGIYS